MKLKQINIIRTILSFMLLSAILLAGDVSKVGTVSASQLLIPIGARSISMGGAVLSDVSGTEALYWNPAGVAYNTRSEVMFSNMDYLAGIKLNYFAAVYNGGSKMGALGLFFQSLDFGDIEETTEEMPDGTGIYYSPSHVIVGFNYSRMLTDRIISGVTGKYIYESIMETSAAAVALDMGIQYQMNDNIRLGIVMKNIGSKMQYDGRNLEQEYQLPGSTLGSDDGYFRGVSLASNIPSTFSFGVSYKKTVAGQNIVNASVAFTNSNDYSDMLSAGMEYSFDNKFFLRAGYNYETQEVDERLFGMALGGGLCHKVGNFNLIMDYSYRDVKYFNANHIFSIKIGY